MANPFRYCLPLLLLSTACRLPNPLQTSLDSELTTGSSQINVVVVASDVSARASGPSLMAVAAGPDGTVSVLDAAGDQIVTVVPGAAPVVLAGSKVGMSASQDGQGTNAILTDPVGMARDPQGSLWLAEGSGTALVRRVSTTGMVTTVVRRSDAPDLGSDAAPPNIVVDGTGTCYLLTTAGSGQQTLWRVNEPGSRHEIASLPAPTGSDADHRLSAVAAAPNGGVYGLGHDRTLTAFANDGKTTLVRRFPPQSDVATTLMAFPQAMATDPSGNVYILGRRGIDYGTWQGGTASWFVQKVDVTGTITPVLSCRYTSPDPQPFPGIRIAAAVPTPPWLRPITLAWGADGKLYVADSVQNRVLKVTVAPSGP